MNRYIFVIVKTILIWTLNIQGIHCLPQLPSQTAYSVWFLCMYAFVVRTDHDIQQPQASKTLIQEGPTSLVTQYPPNTARLLDIQTKGVR